MIIVGEISPVSRDGKTIFCTIACTRCAIKSGPTTHSGHFVKAWPIFKILSQLKRSLNFQQNPDIFPDTPSECCCTTSGS